MKPMPKAAPMIPIPFARFSDRKSTRLNSSHEWISYAVFCLKKKKHIHGHHRLTRETLQDNFIDHRAVERCSECESRAYARPSTTCLVLLNDHEVFLISSSR